MWTRMAYLHGTLLERPTDPGDRLCLRQPGASGPRAHEGDEINGTASAAALHEHFLYPQTAGHTHEEAAHQRLSSGDFQHAPGLQKPHQERIKAIQGFQSGGSQ